MSNRRDGFFFFGIRGKQTKMNLKERPAHIRNILSYSYTYTPPQPIRYEIFISSLYRNTVIPLYILFSEQPHVYWYNHYSYMIKVWHYCANKWVIKYLNLVKNRIAWSNFHVTLACTLIGAWTKLIDFWIQTRYFLL